MERENLITLAGRFKRALSESSINELGRSARFCHRERIGTPFRVAMSLLAGLGSARVETLADLHRCFNALFATTLQYKPFHNQLAKWSFGPFMRSLVQGLMQQLVIRVLSFHTHGRFGEFRRIVIQDGSSFALKDALREVFPGRFTKVRPAAVELHATLDLLDDSVSRVALRPDTAPERAELPKPQTLNGCLLLADRGYFALRYLGELHKAGARFVIRALTDINPLVVEAYTTDATRLRRLCGKHLKDSGKLPKRRPTDLTVRWRVDQETVQCRLLVSWNPTTGEYQYLVTNLPRSRYPMPMVVAAYRLRWQIELLFKEWKSYANLHAFDTRNASIAEGLIWGAIGAAMLKRFLAHSTQLLAGVEVSTRKVAMCAHHVLPAVYAALISGSRHALLRTFNDAVTYLSTNAQRAHPKRDRRTGRSQLGLQPVFGLP